MNTVASFFAGALTFFASLLGIDAEQPIIDTVTPVVMEEQVEPVADVDSDSSTSVLSTEVVLNTDQRIPAVVPEPVQKNVLSSIETAKRYFLKMDIPGLSASFDLDANQYPGDILIDNTGPYPAGNAYTIDQVRIHNTSLDCWILFNKRVYDISDMLTLRDIFPALSGLVPQCGSDVTSYINAQPVTFGSLNTARFRYPLADFYIGYVSSDDVANTVSKDSSNNSQSKNILVDLKIDGVDKPPDGNTPRLLSWTSEGVTNCIASSNSTYWIGSKESHGSVIVQPTGGWPHAIGVYTLVCTSADLSTTVSDTISVFYKNNEI